MTNKIIKKILDNSDKFVIFYSNWCGYSMNAVNLLKSKDKTFKAYEIDDIKGGKEKLLNILKKNSDIINFDKNHYTRPIIFYKGKYIGGFDQLRDFLK